MYISFSKQILCYPDLYDELVGLQGHPRPRVDPPVAATADISLSGTIAKVEIETADNAHMLGGTALAYLWGTR